MSEMAGRARLLRRAAVDPMAEPHRHPSVEFNLVVSGTATYLLDDRRYELLPRTLVWLFPGQAHVLTNQSADYSDWLGLFDRRALAGMTTGSSRQLLRLDPDGHFARRLSVPAAARLESLFAHVAAGSDADTVIAGLRFAVLAAWEAFGTSGDDLLPAARIHPAVLAAARLLGTEAGSAPLPDIAAAVGLSPHHLSRLFAKQIGMSVSRFRNEQRFHRFLARYGAGDRMSVLDAALAAGFGSYPQFYRVVVQLTGSSPAAYLRRVRPTR